MKQKKIKTVIRNVWTKYGLKIAIQAELTKKPGLYKLDLCEKLGADLHEVGECIDELVSEGKVGPV